MRRLSFHLALLILLVITTMSFYCNERIGRKSASTQEKGDSQRRAGKQLSDEDIKIKKQKAKELEQLIDDVRNAPTEVAADILFQLIDSGMIPDNDKKRELLEEVFNVAYLAQNKVKRHDSNDDTDTRSGMLSYGYSLDLDALSLRCKAVKRLITIDKPKARELFKQVVIPELESLSCEDPMVYDVSVYYDTLKAIVDSMNAEEESTRREQLFLVEQAISGISSPVQLGPIAKIIASLNLPPSELSFLVQRFSKVLSSLPCDPRSFAWAMRSLGESIKHLAAHCKSKEMMFDDLLNGYRSFLLGNMTKSWCNDYSDKSQIIARVKKESDFFNSQLSGLVVDGNERLPALQAEDLLPKGVSKPARIYGYWKTPSTEKFLQGIQKLNYGTDRKRRSVSEREQRVWQRELTEYYSSLKSWAKDGGMSEADFFHQKCNLLGFLLELTPKSNPQYESILLDYIAFLSQSSFRQESVIEWLWQARVSLLRMELSKLPSDDILNKYAESADGILRLMAKTKLFIAKYKA